ncbi:unnamed protein product [Linum tenue]|uniref:Mediator of RNA polymerase II transcription subunit 27 n=1 Tax=Linum tenue TaxID=586396 RepID=A0AAV0NW31_9ROSI|nr:unnamed protein product [Linum tenue]
MDVKPNFPMQFQQQQLPQLQQQQQQPEPQAASTPSTSAGQPAEAPPKQVALAMDRLAQAARLIADVRIGGDRLLEALFFAAQSHQSNKTLQFLLKEDASMRQHLQDLRTVGRQLEETGVLNDSMKSRGNSWGLHIPLVCPDGAVVAYAWKRQLAGQAGASAVDRTREAATCTPEVLPSIMLFRQITGACRYRFAAFSWSRERNCPVLSFELDMQLPDIIYQSLQ